MVACGTSGLLGGRLVEGFADNSLMLVVPVFAFAVAFFATGFLVEAALAAVFFVFMILSPFNFFTTNRTNGLCGRSLIYG
jgi:hypothetical protein